MDNPASATLPGAAEFLMGEQKNARALAVTSLGDDPEKAARAQELAEATGAHPALVHENLEEFEAQHKAQLTAELLNGNHQLGDYVNSHPLAAKISNDDLGQLDHVSNAYKKMQGDVLSATIEGWNKGVGEGGLGAWLANSPGGMETVMRHRLLASTLSVAGMFVEVPIRTLSGIIGAGTEGLTKAIEQTYVNLGGNPHDAAKMQETVSGALQDPALVMLLHAMPHAPPAEGQAIARQAQKTAAAIRPYLDDNKVPPVGVDAVVDQLKAQQAETDGANLKELMQSAQKSSTRERSPEMFANFIRQHDDMKISVKAEAVRELYGDKQPALGDNLLGWVPGLADRLRLEEAAGGDIEIPLADWLAKVEPETANALHDNIRVRPGGVTLEEAKEVKPIKLEAEPISVQDHVEPEPLAPPAVEDLRRSAALTPLDERVNDRKVQLKLDKTREDYQVFTLHDEAGEEVGRLNISEEQGGKYLYVNNLEGPGASSLGPRAMRDLLNQVRQAYPEAETIAGRRVTGAREKADTFDTHGKVEVPLRTLAAADDAAIRELFKKPDEAPLYDFGGGVKARLKPREEMTADELAKIEKVNELLDRIVPNKVDVQEAQTIEREHGQTTRGVYTQYKEKLPLIMWAMDAKDPIGVAAHEAIHHLRQYGFFTEEEWKTLQQSAVEHGWLDKHRIRERYPELGAAGQLEEAIAEGFREWRTTREKVSTPMQRVFEKMQDLLEAIHNILEKVYGYSPKVTDIFEKVESGEIGSREGTGPKDPRAFKPKFDQGELDVTRQEDKEMFAKANAIGMTVKQYKKYMELIEKRDAEDMQAAAKANEREIRKRQTDEWKQAAGKIRDEVRPEVLERPDVAADTFLRTGELHGEKIKGRPRLDSDRLTAEQRKALPEDYYHRGGMHPDDMAGLFGYASGDALVARVAQLEGDRKAAGLGANAYINRLVEAQVEQRMQKEHGDLEANILDEAKDHVISQTQMDLLHEETLALGMKSGKGFAISKEDLKAQVKDGFGRLTLGGLSTDKFLANAGRAGTLAERALLEEKPGDAFKYKQQQYISMLLANEAKGLEKAQKVFEKNAKTFSRREVPSVDQEYTNFIHQILGQVGQGVRRSVQDLQENIAAGEYKNLADFVHAKETFGLREVPVADFLFDDAFRKPMEQLTVEEFRAVNDSIKTLIANGRDENKIVRAGEAADLKEVKSELIEQLKTFPERKRELNKGPIGKLKHIARTYLAAHLQLESLFNRWDRGDPQGMWTQYVMRDLAQAANFESALEKKYSRLVGDNAEKWDSKAKVDNTVFFDPFTFEKDAKGVMRKTAESVPLQFTRKNLRAILQNAGNESNMKKLAAGYDTTPAAIMSWLNQHATKADWDWAQRQGEIFEEINKEAGTMYRNLTGIEPEKIDIKPIDTPHGRYAGWYHPVVYDSVWEGQSKKLMGGTALEEENYVRATTPRGYTKSRSGYVAPLSLELDETPSRMKQMLHDIAFRPAVINASKIFYDKDVRASIAKHYGTEYRDLLVPWLKDVANSGNSASAAQKVGTMVLETARQNIIATLIGFNPGTVMKHGPTAAVNSITEVGPINFAKATASLFSINDATGETNWRFAMDTSEELTRRHRHYVETLRGASAQVIGKQSLRDTMIKLGSYPVAMSDLLSAVPTWLAQYEKSIREGEDHGTSVFMADRAVRRAHGSSVITNRPEIMRGGPMAQWISSLYGFFSHILNRQYELMWRAGDTLGMVKEGEYGKAAETLPRLSAMLFSYVIFPAVIEELVTPMSNDEHESWGKKAAKTLARGVSSSWIGIRDIAAAMSSGHDPAAGLMGTAFKTVTDFTRDLSKGRETFSKQHAGNIIQHGVTVFGAATGLTNATEGKSAKFIYNYATGQEKPKGLGDWWHGLRFGTVKERKK